MEAIIIQYPECVTPLNILCSTYCNNLHVVRGTLLNQPIITYRRSHAYDGWGSGFHKEGGGVLNKTPK